MSEQMEFPKTFEKFAEEYGFKDDKEVYTNGSDLIPIFRVKQWLEHDNKLRAIETDTAYECGKHANRWIPVSERLPEKGVDCLVFVKGYDECAYYEDDMVLLPDNLLHYSGYCKHGECEKCEHASDVIYTDFQVSSYLGKDETTRMYHNEWSVIGEMEEVIAWMPLPEPYRQEVAKDDKV